MSRPMRSSLPDATGLPPPPPNRRVGKRRILTVVEAPEEHAMVPLLDSDAEELAAAHAAALSKERLRAALFAFLALVSAFACVYGLVRYTRTSPRFLVRVVEVHGNARRTAEEIRKKSGLSPEQNAFTVDLTATRAAILEDPWIESAALRRKLPGTIVIDVTEREAAALVAVGSDLYLATRQGELFKKPEPGDPFDLPVISGIRLDDVTPAGEKGAGRRIPVAGRALDLASEYERMPMAKALPLQEIHVEDDGSLVILAGKETVELRLGKGSYRKKLEQAARALLELPRRGVQADVVYVDNEAHPERVVVRTR